MTRSDLYQLFEPHERPILRATLQTLDQLNDLFTLHNRTLQQECSALLAISNAASMALVAIEAARAEGRIPR